MLVLPYGILDLGKRILTLESIQQLGRWVALEAGPIASHFGHHITSMVCWTWRGSTRLACLISLWSFILHLSHRPLQPKRFRSALFILDTWLITRTCGRWWTVWVLPIFKLAHQITHATRVDCVMPGLKIAGKLDLLKIHNHNFAFFGNIISTKQEIIWLCVPVYCFVPIEGT